jgi:hypothetical protein
MRTRNLTRVLMIAAIATAVAAGATSMAVGGAQTVHPVGRGLPISQLVSIARGMVASLGDPKVHTAWVMATTKYAAEQATYPGSEPPGPSNPQAFLIAIRGRFVCETCTRPPGAKAPKGTFGYDIWVPNEGVSDFGLQPHIPAGLHRLGPVITLPLTPPTLPAAQLALQPGVGIGPARIGVSIAAVRRQIGPAIGAGQWVLGPLELGIRTDGHGQVRAVGVLSSQATVAGHPLSDGYARIRRELTGWQPFHCKQGPYVLRQTGANGISTWLQFDQGRFNLAYVGPVPAGRCWAPFN